jgi:hypothetical protein
MTKPNGVVCINLRVYDLSRRESPGGRSPPDLKGLPHKKNINHMIMTIHPYQKVLCFIGLFVLVYEYSRCLKEGVSPISKSGGCKINQENIVASSVNTQRSI